MVKIEEIHGNYRYTKIGNGMTQVAEIIPKSPEQITAEITALNQKVFPKFVHIMDRRWRRKTRRP